MPYSSLPRIPRRASTIVRPILDTDIDHILSVQTEAYESRYHESAHSFRAKVAVGPESCFSAWNKGDMAGYLVAMPMPADAAIELDSDVLPATSLATAESLYIHDLAVRPQYRRQRVANVLLVHLYELALRHRIEHFRLVAVQGSAPFWESLGFVATGDPVPKGYGGEAVLMSRR